MSNPAIVVGESSFLVPAGSIFVLVALAVFILGAALWLWSLVDALRTTDGTWDAAGQNKLVWVVVIILLGLLGTILYVAIPRPALSRVPGSQRRPMPTTSATHPL